MNCLFQVEGISSCLVQECESHCVMSVGDRKTNRMMEKAASRGKKCLTKNDRGDSGSSDKAVRIIKGFGSPPDGAGKETLVIPGSLTIGA